MARTDKLVTDLTITLRGLRSHAGVVTDHMAQAASSDVVSRLKKTAAREQVVTDRVARALRDLGGTTPQLRPDWAPSPTALVASVATRSQPLGEALVLEANAVRMIADRARIVRALADAVGRTTVADVAIQVSDLYDEYAGWLVDTAAAVSVNGDDADLVPTVAQRLVTRVKEVTGAPARLFGNVSGSVRDLVGRGGDTVSAAGEAVADSVHDTVESVEDALTPVQAADLPVTRYDSRTASDAVKAVQALSDVDDVSTVLAYESQHKDRKTVLDAGEKRVAELVGAEA